MTDYGSWANRIAAEQDPGREFLVESADVLFIVTPSEARAEYWSRQPGHTGISTDELSVLGKATGGATVDRQTLDAIALIKQTMPGSTIVRARRTR